MLWSYHNSSYNKYKIYHTIEVGELLTASSFDMIHKRGWFLKTPTLIWRCRDIEQGKSIYFFVVTFPS